MYNKEYFYKILDNLEYELARKACENNMDFEGRLLIKVLVKNDNKVIIETYNGKDKILLDNRKTKTENLLDYELSFLSTLERFESNGLIYERLANVGAWYKVKYEGFNPSDGDLKIFYLKKDLTMEDLNKYAKDKATLKKLQEFYSIANKHKFTKPTELSKIIDM